MNIEEIRRLSPQEKARLAAGAVKFCLRHNLLKQEEIRALQERRPGAAAEIGLRSIIRMETWREAHAGMQG